METQSGETVTRARLDDLVLGGRPVYASPIKAGDSIYVVTRQSGTYIFEATPKMKQIAHNSALDDTDFNATPAFADGKNFIRSNKGLYCIAPPQ